LILFNNDFIVIEERASHIFLRVIKEEFSIKEFINVCDNIPRIKLTKFSVVKEALKLPSGKSVEIGSLKPMIELQISPDQMYAYLTVNLKNHEKSKDEIEECIWKILHKEGITFGIKGEMFSKIPLRTKILIAEGIPPIDGDDASIEYYELSENKPVLNSDGSVNHYDMQLIDNISAGEWLGKKTPATKGQDGISIRNETVPAKVGRDYKLMFDLKTVRHIRYENDSEEIFAKIDGAVNIRAGQIGVDNHLIIHGDVDYNTGHIDFDGFVTIKGTVKDKFNVTATNDIAILGAMGIGAVGLIESKEGSISIRGGVNGKGAARIKAGYNVITKYSNEAIIEAGHTIHVGLYAIDSELNAKKILLPPNVGRIIGGRTYATHRIVTGSIGNKFEKPTRVFVEGFERNNILEMVAFYQNKNSDMVTVVKKMKKDLDVFEKNMEKLDDRGLNTYNFLIIKYEKQLSELKQLSEEAEKLNDVLLTKGEGEISIAKCVFPKTMLEMKNLQKLISDQMTGSFYVKGRTIYHNE